MRNRTIIIGIAAIAAPFAATAQERPAEKAFLEAFLRSGTSAPVTWTSAAYAADGGLVVSGMKSSLRTAKGESVSYVIATTTIRNPRLEGRAASAESLTMEGVSAALDKGSAEIRAIQVSNPSRDGDRVRFKTISANGTRLIARDGTPFGTADSVLLAAADWASGVAMRMSVRLEGLRYAGPIPKNAGQEAAKFSGKPFSFGWDYAYSPTSRSVDYQAGAKFGEDGESGALRVSSKLSDVDPEELARHALSTRAQGLPEKVKLTSGDVTYVDDGLAGAIMDAISKGDRAQRERWASIAKLAILTQGQQILGAENAAKAAEAVAAFVLAPQWLKVSVNPAAPVAVKDLASAPASLGVSIEGP